MTQLPKKKITKKKKKGQNKEKEMKKKGTSLFCSRLLFLPCGKQRHKKTRAFFVWLGNHDTPPPLPAAEKKKR